MSACMDIKPCDKWYNEDDYGAYIHPTVVLLPPPFSQANTASAGSVASTDFAFLNPAHYIEEGNCAVENDGVWAYYTSSDCHPLDRWLPEAAATPDGPIVQLAITASGDTLTLTPLREEGQTAFLYVGWLVYGAVKCFGDHYTIDLILDECGIDFEYGSVGPWEHFTVDLADPDNNISPGRHMDLKDFYRMHFNQVKGSAACWDVLTTYTVEYRPAIDNLEWIELYNSASPCLDSDLFEDMYQTADSHLLRRQCFGGDKCPYDRRHLYYQRVTDVDSYNPYGDFIECFSGTGNQRDTDFHLYDNFESAARANATRRWEYCSYDQVGDGAWDGVCDVGFPGGCSAGNVSEDSSLRESLWNSLGYQDEIPSRQPLLNYYFHVLKPAESDIVTEKKIYIYDSYTAEDLSGLNEPNIAVPGGRYYLDFDTSSSFTTYMWIEIWTTALGFDEDGDRHMRMNIRFQYCPDVEVRQPTSHEAGIEFELGATNGIHANDIDEVLGGKSIIPDDWFRPYFYPYGCIEFFKVALTADATSWFDQIEVDDLRIYNHQTYKDAAGTVANMTFFYDSSDADLITFISEQPERTYEKIVYFRGYYSEDVFTPTPLAFNLKVSCNFNSSIVKEVIFINDIPLTMFHKRTDSYNLGLHLVMATETSNANCPMRNYRITADEYNGEELEDYTALPQEQIYPIDHFGGDITTYIIDEEDPDAPPRLDLRFDVSGAQAWHYGVQFYGESFYNTCNYNGTFLTRKEFLKCDNEQFPTLARVGNQNHSTEFLVLSDRYVLDTQGGDSYECSLLTQEEIIEKVAISPNEYNPEFELCDNLVVHEFIRKHECEGASREECEALDVAVEEEVLQRRILADDVYFCFEGLDINHFFYAFEVTSQGKQIEFDTASATQSTTHEDGKDASLPFNEDYYYAESSIWGDPSNTMGKCAGTEAEAGSWWQADLVEDYNVTVVKILMPADAAEAAAMAGAKVIVIEMIWDAILGPPVGIETVKECDILRNVLPSEWQTIKCGMSGNSIKIENAAGAVSFCGIQAFGYQWDDVTESSTIGSVEVFYDTRVCDAVFEKKDEYCRLDVYSNPYLAGEFSTEEKVAELFQFSINGTCVNDFYVLPEVFLYNVNYTNGTTYDPNQVWVNDDMTKIQYRLPTGVYDMYIFVWIENYQLGVVSHVVPFTINTCRFEYVESANNTDLLEFDVLIGSDGYWQYELPLEKVMWSSDPNCTIKSDKYELTRDNVNGLPQNFRTGLGFIVTSIYLNEETREIESYLQVARSKARPGTWTCFLKATTVGFVSKYVELRFTLTSVFGDLNDAPFFVPLIPTDKPLEDQYILVSEAEQLEFTNANLLYTSPFVMDNEQDLIQFDFDFPSIDAIVAVPYENYFELLVDTDLVGGEDAGNHTLRVTLLDDQTIFVFADQIYTFFLVIEYDALPRAAALTTAATLGVIEVDLDLDGIEVTFQLDQAENEFEQAIEFSDTLLNSTEVCFTMEEKEEDKFSYIVQAKTLGLTFPGVPQSQITSAEERVKELGGAARDAPTMKVGPVDARGVLLISFPEEMFAPSDKAAVNYESLFSLSIRSGNDGSKMSATPDSTWACDTEGSSNDTETATDSTDAESTPETRRSLASAVISPDDEGWGTTEAAAADSLGFTWEVTSHESTEIQIQLQFENPQNVSTYNDDILTLKLEKMLIFKSAETGLNMDQNSILGSASGNTANVAVPQQLSADAAGAAEDLEGATDALGPLLDTLTTGNLAVGLVLGASMSYLWGMIRSMQMIVLQSLLSINYPAHTSLFFRAAIVFAAVDIFKGEDFYDATFTFAETTPMTPKFDQFEMSDRNFLKNSGSYFLLQIAILGDFLARMLLNRFARLCARRKAARWIGMRIPPIALKTSFLASLRLFLESYFDLAMCAILNMTVFYQIEDEEEWERYVDTYDNKLNTAAAAVTMVLVLIFPGWVYWRIRRNFKRLDEPEVFDNLGMFYEGLHYWDYDCAQYQFYFMVRRFLVSVVLICLCHQTFLQQQLLLLGSLVNLMYLFRTRPYQAPIQNFVDVFNEVFIYLIVFVPYLFLDPSIEQETKGTLGWVVVFLALVNIMGNMATVVASSTKDTAREASAGWQEYQKIKKKKLKIQNLKVITEAARGKFPDQEAALKEHEAELYCYEWCQVRRWLIKYKIEFSDFPEEIAYQKKLKKYKFVERAKAVMVVNAQRHAAKILHDKYQELTNENPDGEMDGDSELEIVSKRSNGKYKKQKDSNNQNNRSQFKEIGKSKRAYTSSLVKKAKQNPLETIAEEQNSKILDTLEGESPNKQEGVSNSQENENHSENSSDIEKDENQIIKIKPKKQTFTKDQQVIQPLSKDFETLEQNIKKVQNEEIFEVATFKHDKYKIKQSIYTPMKISALNMLEAQCAKNKEEMPAKLKKAIALEKEELEKEEKRQRDPETSMNTDYKESEEVQLGFLLNEDAELQEADIDKMKKMVFEELLKKKGYKYDNCGLIEMKGGDKRQAVGSVLQCLLAIKDFKDYFIQEQYNQIGPRAYRGVEVVLSQFLTGISKRMYVSDIKYVKDETVGIDDIHDLVRAQISSTRQEAPMDALFVLDYLLKRLEEELTPDPTNVQKLQNKLRIPLTAALFRSTHLIEMKCMDHKHRSTMMRQQDLFEFGKIKDDLTDCIRSHYKKTSKNIECAQCDEELLAATRSVPGLSKKVALNLAKNLIFVLGRFNAEGQMNTQECAYPLELDMSEFFNPSKKKYKGKQPEPKAETVPYRLKALIFHKPVEELKDGNYEAYIRREVEVELKVEDNQDKVRKRRREKGDAGSSEEEEEEQSLKRDQWFHFKDEVYHPIEEEKVSTQSKGTQILFYSLD